MATKTLLPNATIDSGSFGPEAYLSVNAGVDTPAVGVLTFTLPGDEVTLGLPESSLVGSTVTGAMIRIRADASALTPILQVQVFDGASLITAISFSVGLAVTEVHEGSLGTNEAILALIKNASDLRLRLLRIDVDDTAELYLDEIELVLQYEPAPEPPPPGYDFEPTPQMAIVNPYRRIAIYPY